MPRIKNTLDASWFGCLFFDVCTAHLIKWSDSGRARDELVRLEAHKVELDNPNINIAKTTNNQLLANGNQIANLGTYVKTDGSSGGLGETHGRADVNLAADIFHRQFSTSIPPTPATAELPDMHGSGAVRTRLFEANDCLLEF